MIDVANALEKVNSTLGSVEDIDINELASSLEKLDEVSNNTELLNDMVHTICNNNDLIIDENVDWKKESEVVKEILTDYKNSEDKENYSISGNTELLEKLQDTEVAVDILKYFGITEWKTSRNTRFFDIVLYFYIKKQKNNVLDIVIQ